jgi:uncharacterized protein YjbK
LDVRNSIMGSDGSHRHTSAPPGAPPASSLHPGAPNTEVELKLRVDDLAALVRIAQAAGAPPAPTAVQTNAFFDTADERLGAARLILRLREERTPQGTRFILTAKGPSNRSGALSKVQEEEVDVDAAEARAILDGKADPLTPLERDAVGARRTLVNGMRAAAGGGALVFAGAFTNERTRIRTDLPTPTGHTLDVVLELDRVLFPGDQVHHEVEMEIPEGMDVEQARAAFTALFQRAGVAGRTSVGKARRFFLARRGQRLDP